MMRAARLHELGARFVLEDVPTPEPGPGEVLVRVAGAGVCHSDLHGRDGVAGRLPLPLIMGHENAGYVASLGAGVEPIDGCGVGDPVVIFGGWGCGRCRFCLGGREQMCGVFQWGGLGRDGGYADYLLVPAARHLLPTRGLDPVEAAPLTDAALTPYSAVKKVLPLLQSGTSALVIGAGGLGQYAIQFLKLLTASTVIVADTSATKRATAAALGADVTIDPAGPDAAGQIRTCAGGEGVVAVLDFVGTDATMTLGAGLLARQGTFVLLGLAGGATTFGFGRSAMECTLMTSNWGSRNELDEVLALAAAGRLVGRIERHPLAAINDVFDRLAAGRIDGRAVLTP